MQNENRPLVLSTEEIARAIGSKPISRSTENQWISEIIIDTRGAFDGKSCIFIALKGSLTNGNEFAFQAHEKGIRSFILMHSKELPHLPESTVFVVENTTLALQKLAKYKRNLCTHTRIVGITGSAGKTIIKEWLAQILSTKYATIASPKSYNSQVGVPLSVWNIQSHHEVGIFEAGISTRDEMENLRLVIQPEIGILTNIGDAHDAGFKDREEKLLEKLQLFIACKSLIINRDSDFYEKVRQTLHGVRLINWSLIGSPSYLTVESIKIGSKATEIVYHIESVDGKTGTPRKSDNKAGDTYNLSIPFIDAAGIENAMHVITYLHYTGESFDFIADGVSNLQNLPLRLEVANLSNNVSLINDAYINDLTSLKVALDFALRHQMGRKFIVVLSEIVDSGLPRLQLEASLKRLLFTYQVDEIFYLGSEVGDNTFLDVSGFHAFSNYQDLQSALAHQNFRDSVILIKGARKYGLEQLFYQLKQKSHTAKLTINLAAIEHNIGVYKNLLKPETKIMAVIKGSAYGSGAEAIGQLLQHKGIDYLSVANADEAKQLRNAGVTMPIVVLNPDGLFVADLLKYNLEPEVFSLRQLQNIIAGLYQYSGQLQIHIKLDTGMHRLGFLESDLDQLTKLLLDNKDQLVVKSIFSHLASSEASEDDAYSSRQFSLFDQYYERLTAELGYTPMRHILNTAGIVRFPERAYEMVRLGLGLYGIDSTETIAEQLEKAHSMTASIIQVKQLASGDSVGYNRRGKLTKDSRIAMVNIGYADGFMRNAGNGKYHMLVEGKLAPIVGNVCMDITMIDVSNIPDAKEGSVVTIFDAKHDIEQLASVCGTIPYEIISRIAPRVVREYII